MIARSRSKLNDYAPTENHLSVPLWLRLVRDGGLWPGYTSLNGNTWMQAGSPVTREAGGVWIGLWVVSHTNWSGKMIIPASFDQVTFTPNTFVQVATALTPVERRRA